MRIYLISLVNADERRSFQARQLGKLQLPFEVFNAVTVHELGNQDPGVAVDQWERPLMPTEVACFFSHYSLWKRIAQNTTPALVLEDDAIISDQLPALINQVKHLKNIDHLCLETRLRKKLLGRSIPVSGGIELAPLYQDRTGAAAYILWPEGARLLVERCTRKGAAIADALISSEYRLRSWQAVPALVVQSDVAGAYGLQTPLKTHSYIQAHDSRFNYRINGIRSLSFKLRRIQGQLKLAIRWIRKMPQSRRQLVGIDKTRFESGEFCAPKLQKT